MKEENLKDQTLSATYCCKSECDHCPYEFKRNSAEIPSEYCDFWSHPDQQDDEEEE